MTSKEIASVVQKYYYHKGKTLQICGFSGGWKIFNPDILIMSKKKLLTDIEIKISRSDFNRDFAKTKHQYFSQGIETGVNYFYFACPENLIKKHEVPSYAGLIYVNEKYVTVIKKAPRLHQNKAPESLIVSIANSLSAKCIWGQSYLTEKNKELSQAY
ncbi:hypothetical protein [Emticicia sp. BO119]|uniref:hypothetical protein n=1 Tax=Emticicia sp. BO119 TaxID=2757768 RepID=UPI0015F03276|nr:hypothetical protein [Emticicia sp. BO119]MBA4852051.1 hypothetical protein [Emticicia sp. BO119]